MDYEYTLRTSAIDLAKHLNAIGLRAEIDDDSLRDHSLKINLRLGTERLGPAIIYASKHGMKVRCHEMKDHSLAPVVEAAFRGDRAHAAHLLERIARGRRRDVEVEAYVESAFVDGRGGYGAVILRSGKRTHELTGLVERPEHYYVDGEVAAVRAVLTWCEAHDVAEVAIYHTFDPMEKLAQGVFRALTPLTKQFVQAFAESPVEVIWRKKVADAESRWNERAKDLAKAGAQVPEAA